MSKTDLYRRAYIGGTFDCLHRGHIELFRAIRSVARETVVSINTDEFAARYKRHPLMPLADRVAVLEECRLVDQVVVNIGDEDSKVAIAAANVDCIIHGSDWQGPSLLIQMGLSADWLQENGIELVIVPYSGAASTSAILAAYEARKEQAPPVVWPSDTVTCATCGRAVYTTDVDEAGNCSEHATPTGHESDEAQQ